MGGGYRHLRREPPLQPEPADAVFRQSQRASHGRQRGRAHHTSHVRRAPGNARRIAASRNVPLRKTGRRRLSKTRRAPVNFLDPIKRRILAVQEFTFLGWRAVANLWRPPIYWNDM